MHVNCITERPLDISVARKNQIALAGVPLVFLLVAARPLNIHILAAVNFKILS